MVDLIVGCGDVEVFIDNQSYYTFFSSPYPSHRAFSAVDIYSGVEFGSPAFSPVEGVVYRVLEFASPGLGRSIPDYLILIEVGGYLARIMHVSPEVSEGDRVSVGDRIGSFIPSGYFSYFVDPHIHLEVRSKDDFVRARGGFELRPAAEPARLDSARASLSGRVVSSSDRNSLVRLEGFNVAEIAGEKTLLDGFSSVGYGGVLGNFALGEGVFFDGIQIGSISAQGRYMSVFESENIRAYVDGTPIAGVSFMYNCGLVMLVPESFGSLALEVGGKVSIGLEK